MPHRAPLAPCLSEPHPLPSHLLYHLSVEDAAVIHDTVHKLDVSQSLEDEITKLEDVASDHLAFFATLLKHDFQLPTKTGRLKWTGERSEPRNVLEKHKQIDQPTKRAAGGLDKQ